MKLLTDTKYQYLCVATASDGYNNDTQYFQVQYLEELTPLILLFRKSSLLSKKDIFEFHIFECSYKGQADLKLDLKLKQKPVTR